MKELISDVAIATTISGVTQVGVEATYRIHEFNEAKYAMGWGNFNISEEFVEGAAPAFVGAVVGDITYRLIIARTGDDYDSDKARHWIYAGAMMGYATMVCLGFVLHSYLGVDDVKWGPYK